MASDLHQRRAEAIRLLDTRAEKVRHNKRDLTVDAIVAATAVELAPSVVITADKPDLELLVDGFDVKVAVI